MLSFLPQSLPVAGSGGPVTLLPAWPAFETAFGGLLIGWVLDVMQALAASFASSQASSEIGGSGDRLQVVRIDATANSTEVVQVKPFGGHSAMLDVENTVGQLGSVYDAGSLTVSVGVKRPTPNPAPVGVDRVAGQVVNARTGGGACRFLPAVMLLAKKHFEASGNTLFIVNQASLHDDYSTRQPGGARW